MKMIYVTMGLFLIAQQSYAMQNRDQPTTPTKKKVEIFLESTPVRSKSRIKIKKYSPNGQESSPTGRPLAGTFPKVCRTLLLDDVAKNMRMPLTLITNQINSLTLEELPLYGLFDTDSQPPSPTKRLSPIKKQSILSPRAGTFTNASRKLNFNKIAVDNPIVSSLDLNNEDTNTNNHSSYIKYKFEDLALQTEKTGKQIAHLGVQIVQALKLDNAVDQGRKYMEKFDITYTGSDEENTESDEE